MTLLIERVVLRLAEFRLEADIQMTKRATALYGPSGSGKTSLLEVIAGLRQPVSGRIVLKGRDLTALPSRDRRIGYVPQDDALFPHLSVRRNILYGARSHEGLIRTAKVLEIESILGRGTGELSGGERKRVALARALLSGPDLLLLDEPLAGIGVELRNRVLDHLIRVRDEFPIPLIYVTHDLSEATKVCEEIVRIERGQLFQPAPEAPGR